jgi:N-acyl-D-amino-acid deacylase
MTGLPAREFGMAGRGHLTAGNFADIVIFDAHAIGDVATFEKPKQSSAGIELVLVNGEAVWRDGKATGARPGKVLKPSPSAGPSRAVHHRCAGH